MKIFYDPKFQEEERSGPAGWRSHPAIKVHPLTKKLAAIIRDCLDSGRSSLSKDRQCVKIVACCQPQPRV